MKVKKEVEQAHTEKQATLTSSSSLKKGVDTKYFWIYDCTSAMSPISPSLSLITLEFFSEMCTTVAVFVSSCHLLGALSFSFFSGLTVTALQNSFPHHESNCHWNSEEISKETGECCSDSIASPPLCTRSMMEELHCCCGVGFRYVETCIN